MKKIKEKELLEELEKAVGIKTVAYEQIRECISLASVIPDVLEIWSKRLPRKSAMDIQEKARELFGWSAEPRTIKECEDFIRSLLKEGS